MTTTKVSRRGIHDWFLQRGTAVVIALYMLMVGGFFLSNLHAGYDQWADFFNSMGMRVLGVLTVIAVVGHAWVGLWTVLTDYVKPASVRQFLEVMVIVALLCYLVAGVTIVS